MKKCGEGKEKGQAEKEFSQKREFLPFLGEIDKQSSATAKVKEKYMQSFKIQNCWIYEMMHETA